MYEELYAPIPDVDAYLERIGLKGEKIENSKEGLDRVLEAHLLHIPFDDLDVWALGACPSLAVEDLFNKIIVNKRGGYCFELNSLFKAFLLSLGFDAYTVICHLNSSMDAMSVPAHCCVIVRIGDKKYFTDVGFGGKVPNKAVEFDGDIHDGYRVGTEGYYTYVEDLTGEEVKRTFIFKDIPALPVELMPLNFNISQKPGTRFREVPLLSLRYPDGNVTAAGKSLTVIHGKDRVERELKDVDELKKAAEEYFGLDLKNAPFRDLE